MDKIWLSIILPVYNVEDYIENCLYSILKQDSEGVEIILVDDGSPDNAGKICDEYEAQYENIRVLHKTNMGSYLARVDGMKLASGEYLWFVDSDDWLMDDSISKLKTLIEESGHADIQIFSFCSNGNAKNAVGVPFMSGLYEGQAIDIIKETLIKTSFINSVWRKCIKKELAVNNPEIVDIANYGFGEDSYLSGCFLDMARSVYVSNEILYAYRDNVSSVTHKYNKTRYQQEKITIGKLEHFADKWDIGERLGLNAVIQHKIVVEWLGNLRVLLETEMDEDERTQLVEELLGDQFFLDALEVDNKTFDVWWEKWFFRKLKKNPQCRSFIKRYINIVKIKNCIRTLLLQNVRINIYER